MYCSSFKTFWPAQFNSSSLETSQHKKQKNQCVNLPSCGRQKHLHFQKKTCFARVKCQETGTPEHKSLNICCFGGINYCHTGHFFATNETILCGVKGEKNMSVSTQWIKLAWIIADV